jgi:hypothetical protein
MNANQKGYIRITACCAWPLEDLETIIDIAADAPPDIRKQTFELI